MPWVNIFTHYLTSPCCQWLKFLPKDVFKCYFVNFRYFLIKNGMTRHEYLICMSMNLYCNIFIHFHNIVRKTEYEIKSSRIILYPNYIFILLNSYQIIFFNWPTFRYILYVLAHFFTLIYFFILS